MMAESSQPSSAAERVTCAPGNLKSPVCKYLGIWSVDREFVGPGDKVVCKQSKLQLAYYSSTCNLRHISKMRTQVVTVCGIGVPFYGHNAQKKIFEWSKPMGFFFIIFGQF